MEETRALPEQAWEHPCDTHTLNLGYTRDEVGVWMRLAPSGRVDCTHWVIELPSTRTDYLDWYVFQDGRLVRQVASGAMRPPAEGLLRTRYPALPLTTCAGAITDVLVRLRSETALRVNFRLWRENAFAEELQRREPQITFLLGLMLAAVLPAYLFVWSTRDRGSIYFPMAFTGFFIGAAGLAGYFQVVAWMSPVFRTKTLVLVAISLGQGFMCLHAHHFYNMVAVRPRLSVPSDANLTQNMTILVNRRDGDETGIYAYLLRYNIENGDIEFVTHGTSSYCTNPVIQNPYMDRWYHIAVVRNNDEYQTYVDGRALPPMSASVGNAATTNGVSIGGWNNSRFFMGEIQEVAIYQEALRSAVIMNYMYKDQSSLGGLQGYYKLGYSTKSADYYRNFAANAPTNTDGAKVGGGTIAFEETDQGGEQSAFDSRKNGGYDAIVPLSGTFTWDANIFARQTPGVAFDLDFQYSSANAFSGGSLGDYDPFSDLPP